MSVFEIGDRVIASTAFYGDQHAFLVKKLDSFMWLIQIEHPTEGDGEMSIHETRLRPLASNAKLAGNIVKKIESIRKHREQMMTELGELRELLVLDGQEYYELRRVEEFKAVVKHTLNHELLYLLSNWENARDYRNELNKG